jgi:hypothetical protein
MTPRRLVTWLVLSTVLACLALVVLGDPVPARPGPFRRIPVAAPAARPVALPSVAPVAVGVAAVPLVVWHGPVEHLFFHPLVLQPKLAFRHDTLGQGFADYFVTAREFQGILDGLWRNGWTLVDAHRALTGRVRVPRGRTPLVLSEDDANYYAYFKGRGLADRLVLDPAGDVRAEVGGKLSDRDLVPMVDAAVRRHPELSADGAKGIIALTGYEGLLGEHAVATDPAARERVRALADRLRATGWTFASHTYGHITLAQDSVARIAADTVHWRRLVGDLLGRVDLLVYPYGSRPSPAGVAYLSARGFPYQFDIDVTARMLRRPGVTVMSRRHVDGFAFAVPGRLEPFFDVAAVRDPQRPR